MTGFRNKFIKLFSKIGNIIPSELLLNITDQKLILPFYHVISNEALPHIRHLYQIKNEKKFIQDLDFILSIYEPIDLITFQELNRKMEKPGKPSFLLTFDDGLKEFHDIIAPILMKKGVPAICFLNSGFIDNKDIFYRYKASLLIDYFEINPQMRNEKKVVDWFSSNAGETKEISRFLLSISYQNRYQLDDLAMIINYSFKDYLSNNKPYLSSNQILSLKKNGFYFGAHSIDHPEYRFIGFDEQIRQTKESIESICTQFALNDKIFSFPFTDHEVSMLFFEKVYDEHIVDISFGCAGQKCEVFANHFQRISLELDNLSAKEIINTELLYFMFKSLIGKNTIKRK